MRVHRLLAFAIVASLLTLTSGVAFAQDPSDRPDPVPPGGSEQPDSADRIDLAAIALGSADVPNDVALSFEAYLGGADIASQLFSDRFTADEIAEIGLLWYYESQYKTEDGAFRIRSYVEQFEDEDAVQRGFDLLEDESGSSLTVDVEDQPGFDEIGEAPTEVTTFTFEGNADQSAGSTIDATFRVGNLLVGIAIDTSSDEEPDIDQLEELAIRLEERAEAVLDGNDLPGIDPGLSVGLLEYGDALVIQEGYLTLEESIAVSPEGPELSDYESGYIRMVVLGIDDNPDLPLPFVTTSVFRFSSESSALVYLSSLETVMPAYGDLARADLGRIPGTDAARALSYTNPYDGAEPDSMLIAASIDNLVLTIEVVGAASLDEAQETARSLFEQQVPCVTDGTSCGTAELPAGFEAAEG